MQRFVLPGWSFHTLPVCHPVLGRVFEATSKRMQTRVEKNLGDLCFRLQCCMLDMKMAERERRIEMDRFTLLMPIVAK